MWRRDEQLAYLFVEGRPDGDQRDAPVVLDQLLHFGVNLPQVVVQGHRPERPIENGRPGGTRPGAGGVGDARLVGVQRLKARRGKGNLQRFLLRFVRRRPRVAAGMLDNEYRSSALCAHCRCACCVPAGSGDVPDEDRARMVILGPTVPHTPRENSLALQAAADMLRQRGNAPRIYQNMLVFLAADRARLQELAEAIRLLVPAQSNPRDPETLLLDAYRLQGNDPLAVRASRRLLNDELLITKFSGVRLRMEMDNRGLWPESNHLGAKQLWEYFARYPYIARLRDSEVLRLAIAQGISDSD